MNYRENLSNWCQRAYERLSGALAAPKNPLQSVPIGARVSNGLSGRAVFKACLARRRGYSVRLRSAEFDAMEWPENKFKSTLWGDELHEAMLHHWLRGTLWRPARIVATPSDAGWTINETNGAPLAAFLNEMGQPFLTAQVFEPDDVPATKENLELLRDRGLTDLKGQRCPVVRAEIVY